MKDLWKSGILVLLVIGVLYIIFLRECKHPLPCPPKGQVLIPQPTWDSILKLANKPPIIHIDTFNIKGDIVYIPAPLPKPVPEEDDTLINNYSDSLVKKDINVWYAFKVRGLLLDRKWSYRPTFNIVKEVDSIFVPKIIESIKLVTEQKNKVYLYGLAGGNDKSFLFGGGVDFITKKETEIGGLYQRFGNENFYSVKLGVKLHLGKN